MFLEYIDFIFVPFRAVWNKWLSAKNVKGSFQMEVRRVKGLKDLGKQKVIDAKQNLNEYQQKYSGQPGQQGQPGQPGQQPGQPGQQMSPRRPRRRGPAECRQLL